MTRVTLSSRAYGGVRLARVFSRIPADGGEVILVDGHSVGDTREITPGRSGSAGWWPSVLREWVPGKDETAPPEFRVASLVTSAETACPA